MQICVRAPDPSSHTIVRLHHHHTKARNALDLKLLYIFYGNWIKMENFVKWGKKTYGKPNWILSSLKSVWWQWGWGHDGEDETHSGRWMKVLLWERTKWMGGLGSAFAPHFKIYNNIILKYWTICRDLMDEIFARLLATSAYIEQNEHWAQNQAPSQTYSAICNIIYFCSPAAFTTRPKNLHKTR